MKRIVYLLLLSILLNSCTNATMPKVTSTSQATITLTPTLTPTITTTPTSTPDPNKPSDATGIDPSTGEYTKNVEENGRTVNYVWKPIPIGNDVENGVTGHWFESRMAKGPINLTGYGENATDFWGKITLNLNIYSIEGFRGLDKIGYLYHPDGTSDYITKGYPGYTLASDIAFDLFLRYSDLLSGKPGSSGGDKYEKYWEKYNYVPGKTDMDMDRVAYDQQAIRGALNNGAGIQVGDNLWLPSKGYDVYWIDEALAKTDSTMYSSGYLYWKVMVENGKLIAILAPAPWMNTRLSWNKVQSREKTFCTVTLFPLEAVLTTTDLSKDISWFDYQGFGDYGTSACGTVSIGGKSITTDFIASAPSP